MYQLTPKDKRAIELRAKLKTDDLGTRLKDYHHFLDTLLYLNEALVGPKAEIKTWQRYSFTMVIRFAYHGLTLHQLWSGLPLSSTYYAEEVSGRSYFDVPSAKAVLRSQLETFLMHHYIYVNPKEDDTKELRYYSWIYTGLLHRQDFPTKTQFAQKQKQKDRLEIERLKNIILNLPAYKTLTQKQQASLIEKGNAKLFNHWETILSETGFTKNSAFSTLYTMLCVYSHSEGLSAIQFNEAFANPSFQLVHSVGDCVQAMQLTCIMITALINMWPAVRERFEKLPEQLQWDVELLTILGKAPGEALQN